MQLKILKTFHYFLLQGTIAQYHLILPRVIDKLDPWLSDERFDNQKKEKKSVCSTLKRPLRSLEDL